MSQALRISVEPGTAVSGSSHIGSDLRAETVIPGLWAISAGSTHLGMLNRADLEDYQVGEGMALHSRDETLRAAAEAAEHILRDIFGERAYVTTSTQMDPETGSEEAIIEAHYCLPAEVADFERVAGMHREFRRRYVSTVAPETRSHVALVSVAVDGD